MKWQDPDESADRGRFRTAFGQPILTVFERWWRTAFDSGQTDLMWVSFGQLFLHRTLETQHPGVVKVGKKWLDGGGRIANPCRNHSFRVRSKWFRLMVQEFMKSVGIVCGVASLKPRSDHLACHIGCLSAPFRHSEWLRVERWLRQRVNRPIRLPHELDALHLDV